MRRPTFSFRGAALVAFALLPKYLLADRVDDYLRSQMGSNHIPGLVVAVVKRGKIIKLKGYGTANLEWPAPVTADTEFQLASSTKMFTGSALMLLAQEGKLALDDPIAKYLPGLPGSWGGITIRHLATHSSGVPNMGDPEPEPGVTIEKVVEEVAKLPLEHKPGAQSGYDSADFVLLASVIERITKRPFTGFLSDRLFRPLGMTETRFDGATQFGLVRTSDLLPRRAGIYRWNGSQQGPFSFLFPIHAYSAGGVYSSARDLARWAIALDQGQILSPESKRQMWSPNKLNDGQETSWGVGWVVRTYEGRRTAGHSGGPALSDVLRFLDDGLTVVVLQNQQRMYPYLAQGVADFYLPPNPKASRTILDPAPNQTRLLRAFFEGMGQGKLEESLFAPDQGELTEDTRNLLVPYVRSLTPLQSLTLVETEADGEGRRLVYAAVHGKKVVTWTVWFNKVGRIVGLDPKTP